MKPRHLAAGAAIPMLVALITPAVTAAADPMATSAAVCWVEYGGGNAPGQMGSEGATSPVWRSTTSGLLVRRPRGDVLIDAGWSHAAEDEVKEFAPGKGTVAGRVLAALSWRLTAPQALKRIGEDPAAIATIVPTHAHFDHMAGAVDIPGRPVLLSQPEIDWLRTEEAKPDVVPASTINALRPRLKAMRFVDKPYLVFERSFDLFGDGTIIAVPLPGHTPGAIGVFVNAGGRTYFATGDATFTYEAIERSAPKMKLLRDYADADPVATEKLVGVLAALHAAHPEILMLPSHDRTAWERAFGPSPGCKA